MTFGEKLKLLRTEKGVSQQEFSDAIEVTRSSGSLYETDSNLPNIETLLKICNFYNVSADFLIGRSEARKTDSTYVTQLQSEVEKYKHQISSIKKLLD